MRHRKHRNRLNAKPAHGKMMQRNLLTSLLLYEEVRTTKQRARVVRPLVDRIISIAKKQPPHVAIRTINRFVTDKNASKKVMEVFIDRYKTRDSGLTHIKAAGYRKGDGAELVDVRLVDAVAGAATSGQRPPATSGQKKEESSASSDSSASS